MKQQIRTGKIIELIEQLNTRRLDFNKLAGMTEDPTERVRQLGVAFGMQVAIAELERLID